MWMWCDDWVQCLCGNDGDVLVMHQVVRRGWLNGNGRALGVFPLCATSAPASLPPFPALPPFPDPVVGTPLPTSAPTSTSPAPAPGPLPAPASAAPDVFVGGLLVLLERWLLWLVVPWLSWARWVVLLWVDKAVAWSGL